MRQYYGKYRGQVRNNLDPLNIGRIEVSVPAVLGDGQGWATPCVPYAGPGVGLFALPPVGAAVWVEFENGDPDYPIWAGCFWGPNELPQAASSPLTKVLRTGLVTITLTDAPGAPSVIVETQSNMKLVIDAGGIELTNGTASVKLAGTKVLLNGGALEVE